MSRCIFFAGVDVTVSVFAVCSFHFTEIVPLQVVIFQTDIIAWMCCCCVCVCVCVCVFVCVRVHVGK